MFVQIDLTLSAGELYATQFFSSKKLKFILFLTPAMLGEVKGVSSAVLDGWRAVANAHKGQAIFSYMTQNAVADVMDYFAIDVDKDVPLIAAHQPSSDFKYKSKRLDLTDSAAMLDFVSGVVSGSVDKVFRSEAVPLGNKGPVITAVGSTVLDIVSKENKDVMLMVYTPWCANCRKLLPTFDILGRAVEAENRVVVVRLDASKNDIPAAWGVKSYPALLWFPSKDKPYMSSPPQPRPYWDAGQSLQELVSFVQRQSSFDLKTLRVATSEQIGSLLGDEEVLRTKYDEQERTFKRNEGRAIYDQPVIDYLLGEVVFDGKRGHFIVAALLLLICLVQFAYIIVLKNATAATVQKKKK
jgi:thiol-disulfide isomerase/thioredoxin